MIDPVRIVLDLREQFGRLPGPQAQPNARKPPPVRPNCGEFISAYRQIWELAGHLEKVTTVEALGVIFAILFVLWLLGVEL